MFVGVCRLALHLRGNSSLKGKRAVLRRVIERTRAKFNAAVAEVGDNDVKERALIGIAVVGNSSAHVDSMLGTIGAFVERLGIAPVGAWETEVIPLGGDIGSPDRYLDAPHDEPPPWSVEGDEEEVWEE